MDKFSISLNLYTPGEADEIVRVSPDKLRDWRRRGFLPKQKGQARFNVFDLAHILMLRLAADYGLGLERFQDAARLAALGIVYFALRLADHYEGPLNAIEAFCVIKNKPNVKVLEHYGHTTKDIKKYMIWWTEPRHLAEYIVRADDKGIFTDNLDNAFSQDKRKELNQRGPIQVFNLEVISHNILAPRQKPFVKVNFATDADKDLLPKANQTKKRRR